MSSPGRVFQPVRGRPLRKLLWKRLHLPHGVVHPALRFAKRAANPSQLATRRAAAAALAAGDRAAAEIPERDGYRLLQPGELPDAALVAERCAALFEQLRPGARPEDHRFNPRKRFLLSLLRGADFSRHPELLRFMLSRPLLDTASRYLGSVPLLAGAALWWTPPNDSAERSQLFHFDAEDDRQLKLFVNVLAVGAGSGPVTWLPADASAALRSPSALRRRISDVEVERASGLGRAVRLLGAPGSAGFVDTSRCLHFGSRASRVDRVVLMVQYLRFDSPSESTFRLDVPPGLAGLDPDPVQKLALGWV